MSYKDNFLANFGKEPRWRRCIRIILIHYINNPPNPILFSASVAAIIFSIVFIICYSTHPIIQAHQEETKPDIYTILGNKLHAGGVQTHTITNKTLNKDITGILPVTNGGTSLATLPSSSTFWRSDGALPTNTMITGTATSSIQTFTSSTSTPSTLSAPPTWTIPTNKYVLHSNPSNVPSWISNTQP